jgi:hypothetical protein
MPTKADTNTTRNRDVHYRRSGPQHMGYSSKKAMHEGLVASLEAGTPSRKVRRLLAKIRRKKLV